MSADRCVVVALTVGGALDAAAALLTAAHYTPAYRDDLRGLALEILGAIPASEVTS